MSWLLGGKIFLKKILNDSFDLSSVYRNSEGVAFNIIPYFINNSKIIPKSYEYSSFDVTVTDGLDAVSLEWVRTSSRPGEHNLSAEFYLEYEMNDEDGFSFFPIDYSNEIIFQTFEWKTVLSTSGLGEMIYANDVTGSVMTEYEIESPDNFAHVEILPAYLMPRMYDVTFSLAGEGKFADGSTTLTEKVIYCERIKEPDMTGKEVISTKKGVSFAGWDIERVYPDGFLYNGWYDIPAKWKGDLYGTFSFGPDKTSSPWVSYSSENHFVGNTFNFPTIESMNKQDFKKGYKFVGWEINFEDKDGQKYNYVFQPGNNEIPYLGGVKEHKLFVAKWEPIKYKVAFDLNGGNGSMSELELTYDVPYNLPFNNITKTGYQFDGCIWNDAIYKPTEGQSVELINLTDIEGEVLTFVAQWAMNQYWVVYHANHDGAEIEYKEKGPFNYNEVFSIERFFPEFCKVGYVFSDWRENTPGSGIGYETYSPGQEVSKLTTAPGGKVHLYAQFTPTWASNWGADVEPEYSEKNGVKTYYISSRENLAWLSLQFHKLGYKTDAEFDGFKDINFVQTRNISLWNSSSGRPSQSTSDDPLKPLKELTKSIWLPIGNSYNPFRGKYNGNGYNISYLMAITDLEKSGGLFGVIEDCEIRNVEIEIGASFGLYDTSEIYGTICGQAVNCNIDNCKSNKSMCSLLGDVVDSTVKNCLVKDSAIELADAENIGVFANRIENSNVVNCGVVSSTIVAKNNVGIIAGRVFGGKIENCYSQGVNVEGENNVGFIGYAESVYVKSCINKKGHYYIYGGDYNETIIETKSAFIKGKMNVGGIIGVIGGNDPLCKVKIENCYVDYYGKNSEYRDGDSIYGDILGGIVGYVSSGVVKIISCGVIACLDKVGYLENQNIGFMIGKLEDANSVSIEYSFGRERASRYASYPSQYNKASNMVGMGLETNDVKKIIKNCIINIWEQEESSYYQYKSYIYFDYVDDVRTDLSGWIYSGNEVEILPKGFSWLGSVGLIPYNEELCIAIAGEGFQNALDINLH